MRLGIFETRSTDPYRNLAIERYLLENVRDDQVVLYLWQNHKTVVIGRNQSALQECRIQQLEADGGLLARRLSGGGAVYHDRGNLNFTFVAPATLFDEEKQTRVVLDAVRSLGIEAERTGRNDLLADGRKFSGHAYYHTRGKSYHHGTLLVNADLNAMEKYLNPSPLKLASKGVASVKQRAVNLADLAPGLSVADVSAALRQAFQKTYGATPVEVPLDEAALAAIDAYRAVFASDQWLYRGERPLENSREAKFDWGLVRIDWTCVLQGCTEPDMLQEVALYSDGLEADFLEGVPRALRGCAFTEGAMKQALCQLAESTMGSSSEEAQTCINDLVSLILQKG